MRVYKENANTYMVMMDNALSKDSTSFDKWVLLHCAVEKLERDERQVEAWQQQAEHIIKPYIEAADSNIILCQDGDVMVVARELSGSVWGALKKELADCVTETCISRECNLYDLRNDWRDVRDIFAEKTVSHATESWPYMQAAQGNSAFGEIASMSEVFAQAKQRRKARSPMHIMLVEDDAMTRRLVASLFKDNYVLITAANAEEAMTNYLMYAPDIIFLDIGLPDQNGFEVLHSIVSSDEDAYIVMFSANSYLDNITLALGGGASGFIAKPFRKERMDYYINACASGPHYKYNS